MKIKITKEEFSHEENMFIVGGVGESCQTWFGAWQGYSNHVTMSNPSKDICI